MTKRICQKKKHLQHRSLTFLLEDGNETLQMLFLDDMVLSYQRSGVLQACHLLDGFNGKGQGTTAGSTAHDAGIVVLEEAAGHITGDIQTGDRLIVAVFRRPNLEQVFVLDWNKGMRFGIVTKAEPDPVVEEYVRQLQHLLPLLSEKLFGMKLEPVEE